MSADHKVGSYLQKAEVDGFVVGEYGTDFSDQGSEVFCVFCFFHEVHKLLHFDALDADISAQEGSISLPCKFERFDSCFVWGKWSI